MLNFFARSRVLDWEKVMLKNIFFALPKEFHRYSKQIDGGLLRSVRFYRDRNYMNFTYHEGMAELFEKKREPYMILKLIRIFDLKLQQFVFIEIHTTHGLIIGYATPTVKKISPDVTRIDVSLFQKSIPANADYDEVKVLLKPEELLLINPSDVYEIELAGRQFYHLKDLEDGDFIAIDKDRNIYEVSHDPFNIDKSGKSIEELLK